MKMQVSDAGNVSTVLAMSNLDVTDALLSTTRSVRKRLDFNRVIEASVVEDCLRLAFQAPSGANSQQWSWILVEDPGVRAQMADIYRGGMSDHAARENREDAPPHRDQPRVSESVRYLADNLQRVPVLLVPTIGHSYGRSNTFAQASTWGSILPAVWSFMLALRSRGMGSAWTTIHLYREKEMADLLGIPYPEHTQVGLFPVAYTLGTEFRAAERKFSDEGVFWNRWGQTRENQ
jgi:nitroreductase